MSKEILILYCSRTGFTQRYAQWLAEALDAEVLPLKNCPNPLPNTVQILLCGGGIYGSELAGLKKYRKLQKKYPDKEFLFFATGASPQSPILQERLLQYNFKTALQPPFFYLQGGLNLEELAPSHKTMLNLYKSMMKRRREPSEEETRILALLDHSFDASSQEQLLPLLVYLKQL